MTHARRRPSPIVLHLAAALVAAAVVGAAARALGLALVPSGLLVWAAALLAVLATGWLVARRSADPARSPRLRAGFRVLE